ncbi:hypothetical protein E0W41_04670 [Neisseria meningitidis]|nr:hypothetical protein [Neisseria meningitidis]
MRNKQTPSKQASKQASKQKIITPFLPTHALSARRIPLFPPLKPAFSSGRVSARLFSLFSFPRHACAPPATPCHTFAPGRHRSVIRFSVLNTPVSERNADVSTHRTTYKAPPYVLP